MIENVTPLIDSLEIRLSDIFEFEDVEFQCPAGGGMVPPIPPVNRNFHAVAKYTSPDTAAINCRLEPTVGGGTPKYPGPAQHNGGEDVFPFALSLSDCSPPLYALKADGNISHSTAI